MMYEMIEELQRQIDGMKEINNRLGKLFGEQIPRNHPIEICELGFFRTKKSMSDMVYEISLELDRLRYIRLNAQAALTSISRSVGADVVKRMQEKINELIERLPPEGDK